MLQGVERAIALVCSLAAFVTVAPPFAAVCITLMVFSAAWAAWFVKVCMVCMAVAMVSAN